LDDCPVATSEDGQTRLQLRSDGKTIWLTQLEIAELFQTTKQNVSLHASNIFKDGEVKRACGSFSKRRSANASWP